MNHASLTEISKYERYTEQCMKCGFCSSVCPVYQEEKTEAGVARGKNELIKRVISGELELNHELADRIYKCTTCMACTELCPAKAVIPRLIVAVRADISHNMGMRFPYGQIYRHLLSNRKLFGSFLSAASFVQSILMPKTTGSLRHMPDFLSGLTKGRRIPSIAKKFLRQQAPEINKPKTGKAPIMRIGYFTGCMNEFVTPQLGLKTIDFLTRHGVEVVIPRNQSCCGAAVFLGGGDFDTGREMANANIAAFEGLDYVITDCGSCACALEEYPRFLANTQQKVEEYIKFACKIKHTTQFLTDILDLPASAFQTSPEVQGKKITWHDPCHLNRHLGVKQQPRKILQSLDANFIEMPNADRCCGMGGQFSLLHPDLSKKIGDKKTESIAATDADIVVTACPGCQFQLQDGIIRLDKPQKVMNIMELLR
jgi:glycolate oxidase iron-sulfur subunit